jgi:glucose-1-phosphate thymidylyltransferase
VGGRPVLSYILDDLLAVGVTEAIFITGHLRDRIEAYVLAEYPQVVARFVEQPVQNGTAGAVHLARPYIDTDVIIVFVDTLFDADLSLVSRLPAGLAGVIWAKEVEDYRRFGVIVADAERNMQRIVEKPADPISKLANIGLYYIRDWRLLFDGIDATMRGPQGLSGEYYLTDAFQYMIDQGARIRVEEVDGWYDCGQIETLLDTNRHLLEHGRARQPDSATNSRIIPPVRIEAGVRIEDSEVGPNVTIGAGSLVRSAKLRDCIIGSAARIERAELHDSLVGNDVVLAGVRGQVSIGDNAVVAGA